MIEIRSFYPIIIPLNCISLRVGNFSEVSHFATATGTYQHSRNKNAGLIEIKSVCLILLVSGGTCVKTENSLGTRP